MGGAHDAGGDRAAGCAEGPVSVAPAEIAHAAALLRAGALVVVPTETVYGLAADAANPAAVAALYALKERPRFNPLIAHFADAEEVERALVLPTGARRLAQRFWPGPLTLVAPHRPGAGVCALARAGLDTLAARVSPHPVLQAVLRHFGGPVAAPSANPSGRLSPTSAAHVRAGFGARTPFLLDAGPCALGLESTVIGFDGETPVLLRAGALSRDVIEAEVGRLRTPQGGAVQSPGQLGSHYAPRARLRLQAEAATPGELLLGFGPVAGEVSLSPAGDLAEAAAKLFELLHQLDARAPTCIAVAPIPNHGLGEAINDRLARAAAERC